MRVPVQMWAGVGPVRVQMWEVSPVRMWEGASPVPMQMRQGVSPVLVRMWQGRSTTRRAGPVPSGPRCWDALALGDLLCLADHVRKEVHHRSHVCPRHAPADQHDYLRTPANNEVQVLTILVRVLISP